MPELPHLFTPLRIGSMEIANRIAMAPMTVDYGNPDETPSERQIAYYAERARGGPGLICVEVCSVDPRHRYQQRSLGLHSDGQIAGHRPLVDAIHAHGVKVQPQLSHPGPESLAPFFHQIQPMGPSVIRTETTKQACREITPEEIAGVIAMYGDAAVRARAAGYDGIELHAAHSYMMLGSFLSPLRNFRTDEYAGGSFEGRSKLLFDVLRDIKAKVGDDFPITVRLSGFERESGGREINDTQRLAPLLVEAGVSCFHVSGGVGDANITQIITGPEYQPGYNLAAARAIKQVVDVPVMVVGQNMDPAFAESILADGSVDVVAMGRALLADPELPRKAREGRLAEINACTLCQGCVDIMTTEFNGAGCVVNPRAGKEREFPLEPAAEARRVVVVGGGPAGLATAVYAAERGHDVTLIEREPELGGRFRLASTIFPHNQRFLDYLLTRIAALPVDVRLGEPADEALVKDLAPDVLVVAAGGRFESPSIRGDDGRHVVHGHAVLELVELARRSEDAESLAIGHRIVIIGANLIGIELAEHLARLGKRVSVLEPSRRLAMPAGKKRRGDHGLRLDRLGVPVNTGVAVEEIVGEGVRIRVHGGAERVVPADTVIVVGQPEADSSLADALGALAPEVHVIGDTTGFGLAQKAVREALEVAWGI
jgi:2,4-dienoyl-CoA reductase (NADPH2)